MHGANFIQDLAVILLVAGVVGWACQKIGLSVIVGFLAAGILVGPASPIKPLISDTSDIEILARIGLIFLMFAIGLKLSLRKLRRLGPALLGATTIGALGMYAFSRLFAAAMGWTWQEGLFLAGMLMVSSSAIISKILHETGTNHERHGQLAMGIAVLEDVVAVVMLTILNSIIGMNSGGGGHSAGVSHTLAILGAFVVLIGVAGLLIVPWLLRRMSVAADEEIQTIGLAAILFGISLTAERAGYSLAMGAFLLGIIVAETPHRHQVERTFEGMRDVFTAVFFVAIGLQIDVRDLIHGAPLILGVALFTLVFRPLCVSWALALIGIPSKDCLRAGLTATPIGEFSFIIAQVGVAAMIVRAQFYPLAVGVSLVTTLVAPLMARRSSEMADRINGWQPKWLRDWLQYYQDWLERIQRHQKRSPLWQLLRKRLIQVGVEMLFVTGLLIFSKQLFDAVVGFFGHDIRALSNGVDEAFWIVLALLTLIPLVAIWRNFSAMALLLAQVSTSGHPKARQLAPAIETGLKALTAIVLSLWLLSILPDFESARWVLLGGVLVAVGVILVFRRKIVYWHCMLEVELQSVIETGDNKMTATTAPWLQPHPDWNLHMIDCALPDLADVQGKTIAQLDLRSKFGCSVVGIERQGFMIPLPSADAVLYPRDKVLLLGTVDQVRAGKAFLAAVSGHPLADSLFEEIRMEALPVAYNSRATAKTLEEISPARVHGVQIAGIHRGGIRILNPGAQELVRAGDELLVLGAPVHITEFKGWLAEPA